MENSSLPKIGLVTGGSRGLGKDTALRLADHGHDVIPTYQTKKEAADEVVRQVQDKGRKAVALPFDAAEFAGIQPFVDQVKHELAATWNTSHLDFLINNAGIGATIPFEQVTEHDFDLFLNIHFKSVYFLTQALLPIINDNGRIINISTGTTRVGVPGYSVYASMKSAVETFTRYLAKEIGARGITVNVVAPGPVETDFNNGGNRDIPERKKFLASMSALGRVGKPEDIGGVVAFLCSADAGWINGQRIEVSGGMSL